MKRNDDGITTGDDGSPTDGDGVTTDGDVIVSDDGGRRRGAWWIEKDGSTERCERALAVIRDRTQPLPLSELAESITDRRGSNRASHPEDSDDEYCVQLRLHHVDLPKLQARGEIEYDPARHVVL